MVCVFVVAACGDEDDPVRAEPETYSGITKTDTEGNVLEDDPDDWRNTSFLELRPAYPNPATRPMISVELVTADDASASVVIRTPTSIIRSFSFDTPLGLVHRFTWDQRNDKGVRVPDGIYRVFVSTVDPQGKPHRSYGDILMDSTPED